MRRPQGKKEAEKEEPVVLNSEDNDSEVGSDDGDDDLMDGEIDPDEVRGKGVKKLKFKVPAFVSFVDLTCCRFLSSIGD